jgi:hypothetical protein
MINHFELRSETRVNATDWVSVNMNITPAKSLRDRQASALFSISLTKLWMLAKNGKI